MKYLKLLLPLVMAIVMMAMSPQRMWAISGNGTLSSPYQISSADDWATFRTAVNSSTNKIYAKLMNNITLTGNYTPVGTSSNPFLGELDGNNKTITIDKYIQYQSCDAFGLFAYIDGAYIHDLKIDGSTADSKISAQSMSAGTLVGVAKNTSSNSTVITKIYNVQSSVNLSLGAASGYKFYGGIVGVVDGVGLAEIKGCTYSGKITANSNIDSGSFGGVVGNVEMKSKASIAYCFFSGEIETESTSTASPYKPTIGGILGSVLNPGVYNIVKRKTEYTQYFNGLSNCFSCGTITSSIASYKAGIIGSAAQMTVTTTNTVNNYYLSGKGASTAINAEESDNVASSNKAITISVSANNANYGTVSQSYVNPAWSAANSTGTATQLQVSATTNTGYHYMNWSDSGAQTHTVGLTSDVSLTANFHQLTAHPATEPTCTATGISNDYWSCTTCNNHYSDNKGDNVIAANSWVTPAKGHDFTSQTTTETYRKSAATCTEAATYYYKCSRCDAHGETSYTSTDEKDKALGHDFTSQTTTEAYKKDAATCTEAATYYYKCSRCDAHGETSYTSTDEKDKAQGHDRSDNIHTYCTKCDHSWMYYTASEKVTPYSTAALSGYENATHTYNSTTKEGVIEFTSKLESIGGFAFYDCTGLTSITIPGSVTSIGSSAFQKCTSLTSITIPSSVTSIGANAFYKCTSLQSINIPNSVTSIGANAFYNCFVTSGALTNYSSITNEELAQRGLTICDTEQADGLMTKDNSVVFCRKGAVNVIIPNNVTSIGASAFYNCTSLQSIDIPNNVTSIGNYAFQNCTSLQSITIPSSVTSIGQDAFYNCTSLQSITIPGSVTSIGIYAFQNCTSLTSVAFNSIPQVGSYVFDGCTKLNTKTLTLSDGSYVANTRINFPALTEAPTFRREMATEWETIVMPFAITYKQSNAGYKLYRLVGTTSADISIIEYDDNATILAGTPMLIKAIGEKNVETGKYEVTLTANGNDVSITINNSDPVCGLTLTGVYAKASVATGAGYVFDGSQFVKTTEATNVVSFHAYLSGTIDGVDAITLKNHTHSMVCIDAVAATCNPGNTKHWKCTACGKLFNDAEGLTETTLEAVTIPALGHDFTSQTTTKAYLKSAATCTEAATYYYKCIRCEKKGTESYTSTEDKDKALGHNWSKYKYVDNDQHQKSCATCGEVTGDKENCSYNENSCCTMCGHIAQVTLDKDALRNALYDINSTCATNKTTFTLTFTNSYSSSTTGTSVGAIDGKIYLYDEGNDNIIVAPAIAGSVIMAPNCADLFSKLTQLSSVTFNNFNTSNVTDMYEMFVYCDALTSLDLSSFDTSNVTNMSAMFAGCSTLQSIDLSSFDTSNVMRMEMMFAKCKTLQSLTIGNFNMERCNTVYGVADMFADCLYLKNLTLKAVPYLADKTFNKQFSSGSVVNYALSDNSMVYTGTKTYLPYSSYTKSVTYTRSIDATSNWGILVVPFEAKSDDEVQLYTLTGVSGSTMTLKPVNYISASKPCVFKKKVAGATSVTITANKAALSTNCYYPPTFSGLTLTGTYAKAEVATGAGYVFDGNRFVKTTAVTDVAPFRAYLSGAIDGVDVIKLPATPGDLNDDGLFTIADLIRLVEILNNRATDTNGTADVNDDGDVDIDDINALRNTLLGK